MCTHSPPLHPVVIFDPFAKWEIDFMTSKTSSMNDHHYIIVAIDYFIKWAKAFPFTTNNDTQL